MQRSRKPLNTTLKISETIPESYDIKFINSCAVINEIKEFLSKYMRGSCKLSLSANSYKCLSFSPQGLAHILRIIFKTIYNREIVFISNANFDDFLRLSLKFNTSLLDDKTVDDILSIAKKSKIEARIQESSVELDIYFCHEKLPYLSSVSPKITFASLVSVFFDESDITN